MGINKKYAEKFTKAYEGLEAMHAPIYFFKDSENYHKEEWREIIQKYIPNVMMHCYFVSTYGKVYSSLKSPKYPNGGLLIPSVNEHGYYQLNLQNQYNSKEKICVKINRLVLLHFRFIPGCEFLEVDHLNCDKTDNHIWNLEWVKPIENVHRAINNNCRPLSNKFAIGEGNLLTEIEAEELYKKANNIKDHNYEQLAIEYNDNVNYIKGLLNGSIRPYIRKSHEK